MPAAGTGHPRVREYIDSKRNRADAQLLALEGLWAIRRALAATVPVEAVFVCAELLRGNDATRVVAEVREQGGAVLDVTPRVLQRMVRRDGPDGLAAIARLPSRALVDIPIGPTSRLVVADGFDLPGNLGTIVRSADGAGACAVVQTDRRVRVNHPLVVKASMGTVFTTPVVDSRRDEALAWLRARGVRIVAADPSATTSYRDADYRGPVAIVLGNERHGLAAFWRDAADVTVSIPMLGVADSLNVGHAAALLLYEAAFPRTRATQPGRSSRSSSAHSSRRWPADG